MLGPEPCSPLLKCTPDTAHARTDDYSSPDHLGDDSHPGVTRMSRGFVRDKQTSRGAKQQKTLRGTVH